jgi:hypothetical protein
MQVLGVPARYSSTRVLFEVLQLPSTAFDLEPKGQNYFSPHQSGEPLIKSSGEQPRILYNPQNAFDYRFLSL